MEGLDKSRLYTNSFRLMLILNCVWISDLFKHFFYKIWEKTTHEIVKPPHKRLNFITKKLNLTELRSLKLN